MDLWRAIISCFYSGTRLRNTRFLFEMADEYLLLQFIQQQPQIFRFKTYEKLLEKLSSPQIEYSPIVVASHPLRTSNTQRSVSYNDSMDLEDLTQ